MKQGFIKTVQNEPVSGIEKTAIFLSNLDEQTAIKVIRQIEAPREKILELIRYAEQIKIIRPKNSVQLMKDISVLNEAIAVQNRLTDEKLIRVQKSVEFYLSDNLKKVIDLLRIWLEEYNPVPRYKD